MNSKVLVPMYSVLVALFGVACTAEESPPNWHFDTIEDKDYQRTPVVLIHGRGMKPKSWQGFVTHLLADGYPTAYVQAIALEPRDGPNIAAATEQIAPYVESYLENLNSWLADNNLTDTRHRKVDLVAHSMGSLSSRWYTAKVAPEKVRYWISLAGPNHGSAPGCPGPRNSGKRDSCPPHAQSAEENSLQFGLNGAPGPDVDETPFGTGTDAVGVDRQLPTAQKQITYFTFRLPADQWIDPVDSPVLDGAGGLDLTISDIPFIRETSPGNFLVDGGVDHDYIMEDPHVLEAIIRILAKSVTALEAI